MARKSYALQLKGYVGGWNFDRNYVDYVLGNNADREIDVLIDSLGGSVASALSIASAFHNHGQVNVHFVGMNASAATIASLGAKHISIDSAAMYLVHQCATEVCEWSAMNAEQLSSFIAKLKLEQANLAKIDDNIANMYAVKCKKPADQLLSLMQVGGWLTAKEALEWGFVDEITDFDDEDAPILTDEVASALAAEGIPIPNIPVKAKDSAFAKFLASIANLFHSTPEPEITNSQFNQPKPKSIMKKNLTTLCALLALSDVEFEEGRTTLTEAQADAVEDALASKDKSIAELQQQIAKQQENIQTLQEQIASLQQQPAEQTTTVINNGSEPSDQAASPVRSYCDTVNAAMSLRESIM